MGDADALRGLREAYENAALPTVEEVAVRILRALGGGRRPDGEWFTTTGEELWLCEQEPDSWRDYVQTIVDVLNAPSLVGRARPAAADQPPQGASGPTS